MDAREGLDESMAPDGPLPVIRRWLAEALADPSVHEPTAMSLATVAADGAPAARMVLLKGIDDDGSFRFFTGSASRKGAELAADPRAALVLWWGPHHRQVRICGAVERLPLVDVQAYHDARPRGSQIAALTSRQSEPVATRAELEARFAALEVELDGQPVPLPETWGGYRVIASEIELWHSRRNRLHDRLVFTREAPGAPWARTRLQP